MGYDDRMGRDTMRRGGVGEGRDGLDPGDPTGHQWAGRVCWFSSSCPVNYFRGGSADSGYRCLFVRALAALMALCSFEGVVALLSKGYRVVRCCRNYCATVEAIGEFSKLLSYYCARRVLTP